MQWRLVRRQLAQIVGQARWLLDQRWLGHWHHKRLVDNCISCNDGSGGCGSNVFGEVVPRPEEHSKSIPLPEERGKAILQAEERGKIIPQPEECGEVIPAGL